MPEAGMVIVGGGKAGARAIVALRENGWAGSITLVCDEVLLPYDRPSLSKAAITDEAEHEPSYLLDDGMIASLDARLLSGAAAISIDRNQKTVTLANGVSISYDRLLLAPGAEPRRLTQPGAERALMLRDLADAKTIRQVFTPSASVAIIGGGFIGLELAASATKRGCSVTVIEAQPRILMRGVPEEISRVVAQRHKAAGCTILVATSVERISSKSVILSDGTDVAADVVIAGIGASPRTGLAEQAGLATDNGIACNALLQTSDPFVFAAGDCCSFPHATFGNTRMRFEAWRNASDQAIVAAENMLGGERSYDVVPWFWSDQFDLTLQIAGQPHLGTTAVRRPMKDNAFILCHMDADGRLVGASGIGPGNAIARDIRLLEMLIGKWATPDPSSLADASFQLKSLVRSLATI